MTLFRQIAILISLVFIVLLATLAWNSFRQSSHFLQGQMQSAARDMATTLGMTIANTTDVGDTAALETLFNAVFDSGYYSQVELVGPNGTVIHAKTQSVSIRDIPDWFVDAVPITAATGQTQIMKGWTPYGKLSITLHPGYAYASLFENLKSMLLWFALLAIAGLGALWWLLHLLMRPLHTIQQQAEAIQVNRFIRQDPLPKTRELRRVGEAMNRMVGKVQEVFHEQEETLRRYHELLYRDPLTGLGNRRHLLLKLNELCRDEDLGGAWLAVIHVHGLAEMNTRVGYQSTDDLLRAVTTLAASAAGRGADDCARMNNSEFAIILNTSAEEARNDVRGLFDAFRARELPESMDRQVWLCAGMVPVTTGCEMSELLSAVDFALTQAKSQGAFAVYRHQAAETSLPQGKMQWRSWLEDSLDQDRFFLVGQSVQTPTSDLYHRELFVRLRDEAQNVIPAGAFMPVASSLGLEFAIDRAVFRKTLELQGDAAAVPVALNLSETFLQSADALAEFERFVKAYNQGTRAPLYVEVSHFALLQHPDMAEYIAELLRGAGHFFGVDRLDLGNSLEPLKRVRPNYVKVSAAQLADIAEDRVSAGYQALRTLAKGLDIRLVAVGVDSAELHRQLEELGVDAMQGVYLGEPTELQ